MKRKKRGKPNRGKKPVSKARTRTSPKRKTTRSKSRRTFLGSPKSSSTRRVGARNQFLLTEQRFYFRKNVRRRDFESKEFEANLLEKVKAFRKKFKTTKTRTIATVKFKYRGKTIKKRISIGRAEFGNARQRVEDTMNQFRRNLEHYARRGIRFVRLEKIELGKLTRAKAKKKKR